jgi:hypothetical protein
MSSLPDQNAVMQAMMQAGNAMAQGFSQFLSDQQKQAVPGIAAPAWIAESEALKALQQEWMAPRQALAGHAGQGAGPAGAAGGEPRPRRQALRRPGVGREPGL